MAILFAVLVVLSSLVLISTSVNKASDTAIEGLKSTLAGYIKIGMDIESAEVRYITEDDIGHILPVDGITGYNTMNTYYMLTPDVESLPARFTAEGDIKAKLVRFLSARDTERHEYFMSNTFSLIRGRHITPGDAGKALISDVMAELNGLAVGDTVTAEAFTEENGVLPEAHGAKFDYEIVGIFNVTKPTEIGGLTPECDVPENFIMTAEADGINAMSVLYGWEKPAYRGGAIFFTEDPSGLHRTADSIGALTDIDLSGLSVSVNDVVFRMSAEPLERLSGFMTVLTLVVFAVSVILLSLILSMWMRERIRETGVYLAIGVSKAGIFSQHFVECLMIAAAAFFAAWGIAGAAADTVGGALIANMPESSHVEEQASSIEKDILDEPLNIEYQAAAPAAVDISIGLTDWIAVVGIEVFVIFVSVGLSSVAVLRMRPKNILAIME